MSLTTQDAKVILGMLARGDKVHDIAAWFGENSARVIEVQNGSYGTLEMAPTDQLPPKGPAGVKGRRLKAFVEKALSSLREGKKDDAIKLLEDGIARFNRQE